jgi:hypothetical protein
MQELQFMRASDNVSPIPGSMDLTGLAGRWCSSEPRATGIGAINLIVQDGVVSGHVFGAGPDGLIDWGVAPVSALFTDGVSSATCAGFQLRYAFDFLTSHIQANLKLGVMVFGVYQSFCGDGGGNNYFFREFLAVAENEVEPVIGGLSDLSCTHDRVLGASTAAVQCLLGSWRNTNPDSRGIAGLDLEVSGGQVQVRVRGVGADGVADWGTSGGGIFTCIEEDAVPSAAVLTRFDFGFCDCELQIRQNKGILAVTAFNRFHDQSGRSDYVVRELFHWIGEQAV